METEAKKLHDLIVGLIKTKGELIYGDTHVLNISDEEDLDKFSTSHYRVYDRNGYVFDVVREYSSEANDGAGGLVYEFLPCVWDGFEAIKPIGIELAKSIIQNCFQTEKQYLHDFKANRV